jgi:hypothetical protein
MAKSCLLASSGAVLLLGVSLLAACSSGVAGPLPPGDGNLTGGAPAPAGGDAPPPASTSGPAPTSTTPSPPPSSTGAPPVEADAGSSSAEAGTGSAVDSGPGYFIDTGAGTPAPTGSLGSCTNPACATDGTECGCQATDSSGNTVQIGCQAGGQCVCVLNGNVDTNPFDENGACGTSQATAQQFLQYCTCQ